MDIQHMMTPTPAQPQTLDKTDKSVERPAGQAEAASTFSALLQGLRPVAEPEAVLDAEAVAQRVLSEVEPPFATFEQGEITGLGLEGLLGQTQRLDVVELDRLDPTKRLDAADLTLIGQTQKMDAAEELDAQASVLHGSLGLGMLDDGAQPHVAIGQSVATVAAGVSSGATADGARALATAAAAAVLKETVPVAGVIADAVDNALSSESLVHEEGRLVLQGAWKLDDQTVPPPVLTRALGQIEQWAAAAAGVQPKASNEQRVDAKSMANSAAEWLSAGAGSGTRLTDVAVKEAQVAQDAAFDAPAEAPVEDMRFWLQGKQQRAEVILEKDGQPVRVQVSVRGNEAHVMFQTDQAQTRELLDASVDQLRAMLEGQGMQLTGVSVQADGQGNPSGNNGTPNPWGEGAPRHAQVAVPEAQAPAVRAQHSQGIDLYA